MPYRCLIPESYDGKVVGTGQCVAFVQRCAGAPVTAGWRKGAAVKENMNISRGTAIATCDSSGKHPNRSTGNHAAIYISQDKGGIHVYDQWAIKGHVSKNYIRFKGARGISSNDGDDYYIIE